MSYDPQVPKKVMFLRDRVGYDGLVNIAYNITGLDRTRHNISLIFLNFSGLRVFSSYPLVDDNGVDGMYFLKANSNSGTEIYLEIDEICDTNTQPITCESGGLLQNTPHQLNDMAEPSRRRTR